jgi:hypothetical protein
VDGRAEAALVSHPPSTASAPPQGAVPQKRPLAALGRFAEPLVAPFRVAVTAAIRARCSS